MFEKWAWAVDLPDTDDEFVNTSGRRPSELLEENREAIRQIVSANRAMNPRIFGSVSTGTDTVESDLDLIVDPNPRLSLFDIGGMIVGLQELLGVPVDVKTPGDLPAEWRGKVIETAVPV
ncbi:MAG: nucleotidyltransferase family protein [Promicromonosporaceae bacterium]|nr:nucleotidyltransferase family protein [Promicromonosporaceae bacterium]